MDEVSGQQQPSIDFIPTLCFVKRGVAKERPEKVVLTPAEIARVIRNTKEEFGDGDRDRDGEEDDDDDDNEDDLEDDEDGNSTTDDDVEMESVDAENPDDEYNFDQYEQESGTQIASLGDIVAVDNNAAEAEDDEDSESEDEIIKPTDNLVLVGHVIDDSAAMEVWIFNDEEESFYTHHDFLLPSLPLCIEWLNHDPGSEESGNLCAIGCMDPIITIWDLDIQDSIEPTFKLGSKGNRKKNKEKFGHTGAVLDLSWNSHYPHILASGSVDNSVILWDLDEGRPHTMIKTCFGEKVHTLSFHSENPQSLLTGCGDGFVRLFDCRVPEDIVRNYTKWQINTEVEKCIWNPSDGNYFLAGSCDGQIYYADIRQPKKFCWSKSAHSCEISGMCFNANEPRLLTTASSDGFLKIWKFNESEINEVYSQEFNMGRIQCMQQSPDDPFTLAIGGEKTPRFRVYNIKNIEAVRVTFGLEEINQPLA